MRDQHEASYELPEILRSHTTTMPPIDCGDANADASITASDALLALRTAVGSSSCEDCICDADSSGQVTASDALLVLRASVGQPVDLVCVPC